jgi:hypothetical protein
MLELTANGQGLSEVIKIGSPRKVNVKASARSLYPLAKVELIYNGQVAAALPLAKDDLTATFAKEINLDKSGWLALRASGPGHPDSVVPAVYAHTAPIYVEVAGAPVRSKADAQFFLKWIEELGVMVRARERTPNAELRQHIENQLDAARTAYARIAKEGT